MRYNYRNSLNPEKAFIWRIVHRDNLPWILDNGLHCSGCAVQSGSWVSIGNEEIIDRRAHRVVPVAPGGFLSQYVPFYFTPFSPMMYNIHTGRGVPQRANSEIVILVSTLHRIQQLNHEFVFTDAHAYPPTTCYYKDLTDLDKIDWPLLQARNFSRNPDDPRQLDRYQAEALVYQHLPVNALVGMICYTQEIENSIKTEVGQRGLTIDVRSMPDWYF